MAASTAAVWVFTPSQFLMSSSNEYASSLICQDDFLGTTKRSIRPRYATVTPISLLSGVGRQSYSIRAYPVEKRVWEGTDMRKRYAIGGMIAAFFVGLVIGAAGSQSPRNAGLSGTPAPSSSAAPTATATPTAAPTPIALTGRGSKVIDPLTLDKTNYRVSWTATGGSDNFIVRIHGQEDTSLVNEIPPNPSSGEAFFQAGGGHYVLEVKAGVLSWSITFMPVSS